MQGREEAPLANAARSPTSASVPGRKHCDLTVTSPMGISDVATHSRSRPVVGGSDIVALNLGHVDQAHVT